jgi:hypothetical protein
VPAEQARSPTIRRVTHDHEHDVRERAAHVAFAFVASLLLWLLGLRVSDGAPNPDVAAAFPLAILIATSFGSLALVAAAWRGTGGRAPVWSARRALALDAATLLGAAAWLLALGSGPWTREAGGASVVCITALRLLPGMIAATLRAPAWLAFVVALGAYAALAVWLPAASLPLGDQVLYLLGAEQLRRGTLDAGIDPQLFRELVTFAPGPEATGTGVAPTPFGPRSIQGYAMQLVLLPGWALAGRIGAHLTMAVVMAWASCQTFLILRDLSTRRAWSIRSGEATALLPRGVAGSAWILTSFAAPLSSVATHIYPNALSAAVLATAFRLGFTAEIRRPALAAGVLALTLFLTPRDGIALLVLLPFLLRVRADRARVAITAGAVAVVAAAVGALVYGLPVPYAGYTYGISQAQALTQESSITPRFWVNLPAILFDRTFGLAGTAPWVFIGLLGLVPLLRLERASHPDPTAPPILLPAALAVGLSVMALSFVRLWEGGYAPPNRYLGGLLPLWAPFVAFGLAIASGRMRVERRGALVDPAPAGRALRAIAAVAILMSVVATVILAAIPTTALNSAFEHKVRDAITAFFVVDPLGWLPSFQPTTPDWALGAYLRLVPGLAIAAGLAWAGWRVAKLLLMPVRSRE